MIAAIIIGIICLCLVCFMVCWKRKKLLESKVAWQDVKSEEDVSDSAPQNEDQHNDEGGRDDTQGVTANVYLEL